MATNEELRSASEEVETATERLHARIAELVEVNAKLQQRVEQLEGAHDDVDFRRICDSLPLMVWVHGASGEQQFANTMSCEFFGATHDELAGSGWQEFIHPEDAAEYTQELAACVRDRRRFFAEVRAKRADGTWRWLECWGTPRLGAEGTLRGFVSTSTDVTDRKGMEIAARENEQRFRVAKEAASLGIYDYDIPSNAISWDKRVRHLWGTADDEPITYATFMSGVHPEDRASTQEAVDRALDPDGEGRYLAQYRVIHRSSGETRWLRATGVVTFENRRPIRLVGTVEDITDRKGAEDERSRLAAIVESSDDAIIGKTLDGMVTSWNRGAEKLYGYSAPEMIGRSIARIVPADRADEIPNILGRLRRGERVEHHETVRQRKDGSLVDISLTVSVIQNEAGHPTGASAIARDITERKRTDRALRESAQRKDEFLAMLGHELRNPLAAIRSAAEILKLTGAGNPRVSSTQAVLERQSAHMARLLDGLLDVSRIVRGKILLDRKVVDVVAICRDVVSDLSQQLEDRDLELLAEFPAQPIWVHADPVRLTQIADNLLSNAIKYTSDGGRITLALERGDDIAVLRVHDTGVGIEAELLPHVFEVFRQSEQNLDRSGGGLGLGLSLVKALVEQHGGSVEARSDGKNQGAEFIVRLPLTSMDAGAEASAPHHDQPLKFLIIEDNEDSAQMFRELLEHSGHRALVATSAREGLELAQSQQPDVVLCDIGLPGGISGYEVAESLRRDPRTTHLRLIATTGYGRPDDRRRCEAAGFDAHLTKPFTLESITRILGELARHRSPPRRV